MESKKTILSAEKYRIDRGEHWNKVALKMQTWHGWGGYYHNRLKEIYSTVIPADSNVLELGCGNGELLAALNPRIGVGVDFSAEMIALASERYPGLKFIQANAEEFTSEEKFDVVILSDIYHKCFQVCKNLCNQKHHLNYLLQNINHDMILL